MNPKDLDVLFERLNALAMISYTQMLFRVGVKKPMIYKMFIQPNEL
jgi:hypothetical protein